MDDISFKVDHMKFNYRVAALITNGDQVLLQTNTRDDFWSLVGGRVKFNETSKEALIREIEEEIGIIIKDEEATLIHIAENFFDYNDKEFHELLFIYRVNGAGYDIVNKQDFNGLDKETDTNHWFNIEEIKDLSVQPAILKEIINDHELKHSIIIDN